MTLPMGSSISPSMKAIMGITTDSGDLCKTSHSSYSYCQISTPFGILYCALKSAVASGVSTNLAYLHMEFCGVKC